MNDGLYKDKTWDEGIDLYFEDTKIENQFKVIIIYDTIENIKSDKK